MTLYSGVPKSVFSPGILAQYSFTVDFSLMWEWGGANSFDGAAGSTQDMHSQYALPLTWGGHCKQLDTEISYSWNFLKD